jgi:hypothetical protein
MAGPASPVAGISCKRAQQGRQGRERNSPLQLEESEWRKFYAVLEVPPVKSARPEWARPLQLQATMARSKAGEVIKRAATRAEPHSFRSSSYAGFLEGGVSRFGAVSHGPNPV